MNDKQQMDKIFDFIKSKSLAALSTVDKEGKPQVAIVGFSETEDFELIVGTFESSRKFQNIKHNAYVSLAIGWDEGKTVQYEGQAEEITDAAKIEELKRVMLAKMPSAAKYVGHTEERFLLIKPRAIRYTDLSVDPWDTFEIKF